MTSPSLSLGPVLDLIERWQREIATPECGCPRCVLVQQIRAVDIPALRALAEQHAAQLRRVADGMVHVDELYAAADFLALEGVVLS